MTALIDIYVRGVAIVTLVSWNTTLLAEARPLAIIVATVLSGVWWLNARSASRAEGWQAMACYALGAGPGTALACGYRRRSSTRGTPVVPRRDLF